ncbi:PhnD/SsuA/transferrin family substrate-binding protein [Oricola cellulosilytica]|nr:PhnD/SsuA/transferrin family substrate-binding protein [Oricola cellulosilytica]
MVETVSLTPPGRPAWSRLAARELVGLPMYDWPENRAATDARWDVLRPALRREGFDAPDKLDRTVDPASLWTSPSLLLGETCTYPFATTLAGKVRYVATAVHAAPGCGRGTYRSVIVRRVGGGGTGLPRLAGPSFDRWAVEGRRAANSADSLSGFVALNRDAERLGIALEGRTVKWTGSHQASITAVASAEADFAAVDCVSWHLARRFDAAASCLYVAGWTATRPALPFITARERSGEEVERLRRAITSAIDAVILDDPLAY